MTTLRRKHPVSFKVMVALEMIKADQTVAQICSKYSLHPTQARHWKDQAVAGLSAIFSDGIKNEVEQKNELIRELYRQIGQLKVESDFLKKKIGLLE